MYGDMNAIQLTGTLMSRTSVELSVILELV